MFISEIACNSGSEMQRSNVIPSFAWDSVENLMPRRFSVGIRLLLCQRKKNSADHPVKMYNFDVTSIPALSKIYLYII